MADSEEVGAREMPRYRWILTGLILLGLVIRVGAAVWWESRVPDEQRFFFGDSLSYEVLARQVAQGEDFAYGTAYIARTPGYPLMLAPFYWFADEPPTLALRMVGVVCGAVAIGLAAWIARMLFGHAAGLIAAALVTFYPGAIAMSVFILSEAPFAPLMLATLGLAIVALREEPRRRRVLFAAAAGAAFGAAILVRPSWLMFPLFAAPVGLLFYGNRRQQVVVYGVAALSAALVMSPWWVRNYAVVGKFVPTTLQVGASLYDGLGPQATGASDMRYVDGFKARLAAEEAGHADQLPGTFESRLDDLMKREAIAWTRQNPAQALRLAGVKLWRYWTPWGNDQQVRGKMAWVIAAGYLPIVLTGLAGAVWFARRGWVYLLLALPLVYFCLLHLVFVSSIRYRQPPMLALAILSAGLLAVVWQKWIRRGPTAARPAPEPR